MRQFFLSLSAKVGQQVGMGQWRGGWRSTGRILLCSGVFVAAGVHAASDNFWIDITNDRVANVRDELALGEDPNVINSDGQPALMQAIRDGAWNTYDLLVAHRNIDVNATNRTDETPLMYLAVVGDVKRARTLIDKGAQVNRLGWTPLHYAASKGHIEMLDLLIANDAIINAPSPDGTTPLMMAAYAGSEAAVHKLLRAGADVTARNLRKEDAAVWAKRRNHTVLAKKLEALTNKVLAERKQLRAQGGPSPASRSDVAGPGSSHPVTTVDVPASMEESTSDTGSASRTTESGAGSTSRYFDLDRFDQEGAD